MQQQLPEEGGLLGPLSPGERKLEGKCFYLDSVKSRSAALLVEAISLLGGKVESFLHKDVSCVVTGSREVLKEQKSVVTKAGTNWKNEDTLRPTKQMGSVLSNDKQRPGTPRPMGCGTRGKALLEKAIRNNERQQGSSVLANACSWGVKILFVDDVILYLKRLTRESFNAKHKKSEKTYTKHHAACVVKAAALRSPYLKVEDLSRKYKPLYMQSMTFPTLCYSGRFSPFEPPPPPRTEKLTEQGGNKTRERNKAACSVQDIPLTPLSCNPSPWRARKKDLAYCECCRQPFTNQDEHLQSDQHRSFVLDSSNYSVVDQLVADMQPGFNPSPSQQSEAPLNCLQILPPIQDAGLCELEPLTDIETEHAIQALLTQGSSFNTQIPSHIKPLSSSPATPQPDVQPPAANPATLLADSHTDTDSQFPDRQPLSPSPAVPLPDALPLTHCSAIQLSDTEHLSPCPDTLCQSPDPYSLPPVLSPQDPCHILEPHSPYSEPPVLSPQVLIQCPSPQHYTAEEDMEALASETETVQIVSQCVPVSISTPLLPPVGANCAERVKGSNQEGLILGFSGLMHSNNSLECTGLASRRSHSLPQVSMTTPNPKKRCRSASPEHNPNKRRRTSLTIGARCTGQGHKSSAKSESGIMPMAEAYLLFDKLACQIPVCSTMDCMPTVEQVYVNKNLQQGLSFGDTLPTLSACTMEKLGIKQPAPTTFLVPNVQNFTPLPNQIRYVTGLSTSGAGQPPWPVSTNTRILDPPLHFPSDKSHCTLSSQDSHPSLSHSISSVCIESALVPDMATLSPSSSDSDWDCELLSRLGPTLAAPLPPTEGSCGLDRELLQRPCTWMHDTSYESRLHTVLQPSTPTASLCGEEMDPSAFSRTVVQIVEVQH